MLEENAEVKNNNTPINSKQPQPTVTILSDSYGRHLDQFLKKKTPLFQINCYVLPNANLGAVMSTSGTISKNKDYVVFIAGANDIYTGQKLLFSTT